ncbi:response regulator [Desulfobacterales bacterium HSG2]|nr:response regulator [Desulfobacterales bacterium HSG2]
MEETNNRDFRILIVDDVPKNIQVLAGILKEEGYNVGFATTGKAALKHSVTTAYDIILLDIMLPDIEGFEVCRRLKENPETGEIPVIFITAKDSTEDKIRGFEQGAVDFITKPFDSVEVLARVRNHLALRSYASKLEMMVEERTNQSFFPFGAGPLKAPFS